MRDAHVKWAQRAEFELLVFERASNALVGGNGLYRPGWKVPKFEIAYWTAAGFAGRGYATEATRAVAALAFDRLGARRVQIRCEPAKYTEPARR